MIWIILKYSIVIAILYQIVPRVIFEVNLMGGNPSFKRHYRPHGETGRDHRQYSATEYWRIIITGK